MASMAVGVCRSRLIVCAMVVMALALLVGAGVAVRVVEEGCPETEYAYPFQSTCQKPAEFGTEYHLVVPFSYARVAKGGLQPFEPGPWALNVLFTANPADEGQKYVLEPVKHSNSNKNITLGTRFTIHNAASKRYFVLLTTATDPRLLYEAHVAQLRPEFQIAEFELELACGVTLPCPETTGARCWSYLIKVSNLSRGLYLTFVKNSALVVASQGTHTSPLPFLLRRVKDTFL